MSPPLRTWLWCLHSAYTSAFENWPDNFGVSVRSLIRPPTFYPDHIEGDRRAARSQRINRAEAGVCQTSGG
jgi:hypothetical protein